MRGHPTVYALSKRHRVENEEAERDVACLFYGDMENETPEQLLLRQEEATLLRRAVEKLTPREERVIRLWYGLDDEELTLDQIGEQFGVTRERIRQMSGKAERKLVRLLRRDFRDRYKAKAKRLGWDRETMPTLREEMEARWQRQSDADLVQFAQAKARQAEADRLEAERVRVENASHRPVTTKYYTPRLIDPQTGEWEWVAIERYADDASAA